MTADPQPDPAADDAPATAEGVLGAELAQGEGVDLSSLVEAVEQRLLKGRRAYSRAEVVAAAGFTPDEGRSLWRALGFANVDDDAQVFTDADVEALRNVKRLEDIGEIDDELLRAMTRMIGQSFARLASWQGQLIVEIVSKRPELLADGSPDQVLHLIDRLTPVVGDLHDYVWRRQLAAYFSRVASNAGALRDGEIETAPSGVGFVDMAEFTAFTRRTSEAGLRGVLDDFEALATDVVSEHHGQIVKTIGDEVLFVAFDPAATAAIALDLVERAAGNERLPQLRAGAAYGPVVRRLGDVFGQTVNVASRLVSIARPGSVLVDENLNRELRDGPDAERFVLHPMRPVSVRGYRHLRPARLRHAPED
jgi:adenylate cyclase